MLIRNLKRNEIDKFLAFNEKLYRKRTGVAESIRFKLACPLIEKSEDEYPTKITEIDGKIVGQLQLLPCYFFKRGELCTGEWGMDFMVDPEYRRKKFGLSMVKEALKNKHFGMGFAKKALKIHQFLGINLIGHFRKYLYFRSPTTLLKFLYNTLTKKDFAVQKMIEQCPTSIKIGDKSYTLSLDYSLFERKPWLNHLVEFNRDREFMEWRFGTYSHVFKTYMRIENGILKSYFVLRAVEWKKQSFLLLVDYRYETKEFKMMIKAVKKVLKKTNALGLITFSSYRECDKVLFNSGFVRFGQPGHITSNAELNITTKDVKNRKGLFVTAADSDIDFFYGNNTWYKETGKRELSTNRVYELDEERSQ